MCAKHENAASEESGHKSSRQPIWADALNAVSDIICLLDADGRITQCSKSMSEMLGANETDIIGRHCWEVMHGTDKPIENCPFQKMLGSGKREKLTLPAGDKWFEVTVDPIYREGEFVGAAHVMKDITEQKHWERALQESEAQLSAVFNHAPIIIILVDSKSRIRRINQAAVKFSHMEPDNLLQDGPGRVLRCVNALKNPDGCGATENCQNCILRNTLLGALQTGQPHRNVEATLAVLNHEHSHDIKVKTSAAPVDVGGEKMIIACIEDITEQKLAEEHLSRSEEKFAKAFRRTPLIMSISNLKDGEFIEVNDSFLRCLEYEPGEVIGKTSIELGILDTKTRAILVNDLKTKGRIEDRPIVVRTKSGRLLDCLFFGESIILEGEPKLLAIVRDITEQKKALEELAESQSLLAEAQHIAHLGSWRWNAAENEVHWSDEVYNIFGLSKDEFTPSFEGHMKYIPPEEAEEYRRTVEASLRGGKPFEYEFHIVRPDGELCTAWVRGNVKVNENGKPIGMYGTVQDITERKKAEQERRMLESQMQHAQKLESLGVLAGGIAHDFNNLLMAVLGNADLALRDTPETSPAYLNLTEIRKAAVRAAELTAQMLAYSGKGRFVVKPISLNEVVTEMEHLLDVSISKRIVRRLELADDLPAIDADASQIRQVVMNLITNASEAIGDKSGFISITTGVMQADKKYLDSAYINHNLEPGRYVFLEIADTGCGMDGQTISKLFDPFFTTKFTGRGLGMAAVLGIVRGHKGAIKVESKPGKGSRFRVIFPISTRPAETTAQAAIFEPSWKGSGTILLAEDEESVRTVAAMLLERIGFKVIPVSNGRQAADTFRKHKDEIDAVMLDMTMSGISGQETVRLLRKIRKNIKVILTSGYNEQDAIARFAGERLAAFVQKPYELKNLAEVMQKVLGRKKRKN